MSKKKPRRSKINKAKQVPTRQCISCRKQLPRDGFIRLTRFYDKVSGTKKIILNPGRHEFGRSAYICNSSECTKATIKGKKIQRMLKSSEAASAISSLESLLSGSGVKS